MSKFSMTIPSGTTRTFPTAGKYCDKDISITATGGNYDKGVTDGIEAGKQAEYDAFWDMYQQNGERKEYSYAFAGEGWNDTTFQPKYSIAPTKTVHMFSASHITDLVNLLKDAGIDFDLSKDISAQYLVQGNSYLQTLPVLDCTSKQHINYFLYEATVLRSIEKLILKDDGSQKFNTYSFYKLPALEEIRFAGTIGNSLEIKDSPVLSDASVQSIIDHLKDLTGATAQTLTLHATVGANMTDEQKAAITAKNWTLVY